MYNGMYKYNILHPIIVTQAMLLFSSREKLKTNQKMRLVLDQALQRLSSVSGPLINREIY